MSLFGIGAGVVTSVLGDLFGGAMQSHSASKHTPNSHAGAEPLTELAY